MRAYPFKCYNLRKAGVTRRYKKFIDYHSEHPVEMLFYQHLNPDAFPSEYKIENYNIESSISHEGMQN